MENSIESESISDSEWSFDESPIHEDELDGIYDPLEPFNRLMFKVNNALDKVFLTPISTAYKHIFPNFLQVGISNFTSNFFSPISLINYILQADMQNIANTTVRFLINTFFGFFGTADVASKIGFKKRVTTFGDTMKKWGVKQGPYLVLPILGQGSFRTGVGRLVHIPLDQVAQISLERWKKNTRRKMYYVVYGADIIVKRADLLTLYMELEMTSTDMYTTVKKAVMSIESD